MYFNINSMDFIIDSSSGTNSNIISGLSDNIVYNSILLSSSNNLQSNIINTSNYASNISNVIIINTSNYASNISNVLTIRDATNLINTSNYASNISNVLTIRDATNLINTSNYASNISNILLSAIGTGANVNTSNYASNISNILLSVIGTGANVNTSNYASNISNVLLTNINNNFLLKSGGTMTGKITINDTTQLNARIVLSGQEFYQPSNTSTDGIAFLIGVNRTNNRQLWIGDSAKLTQNTTHAVIRIMPNGSVPTIDAVATDGQTSLPINISGSAINLKNNTTITGSLSADTINRNGVEIDNRYLQLTGGNITGNLGIGINNPLQKLHIDSGCLFITNNISNPGTNASTSLWNQAYVGPTISGLQFVVQTNGTIERLRIDNNGLLTTTCNIDCGGSLAITGANAFFNTGGVESGNITNTFINFKNAGATGDWCYLRQIGGNEAYKLAFDFHDDNNDARFCIRSINSDPEGVADVIREVFSVDMGKVSIKGISQSDSAILYLATPEQGVGASKTAIIAEGINSWSRAKLHFCLNNDPSIVPDGTNWNLSPTYDAKIADAKMTILPSGNVGIANVNPSQIFQVGNAGRLRISNGTTDYSLLGTIDTDGATNTRIVISGNTRPSYAGEIGYVATSTGSHIFYTTNSTTERMRIKSDGLITTSGNIDCGGGLAITGSTGFHSNSDVNDGNLTNTYINFKTAGATNDWCYLRQIGGSEAYKLALDFHNDANDARFCIRSITSTSNPDTMTEVFTVDMGNVTTTGDLTINKTNANIQLGPTNGNNWAIPTANGFFSSSAVANDMVLRSINNLILQSGTAGHAIEIDTANNVDFRVGLISPLINLTTSATGNDVLFIRSTVTNANNAIRIQNNLNNAAFIGLGGSALNNYANNFYIESSNGSIILNTQGSISTSTPNFIINTSGNIGIGTLNPGSYKLNVNGSINSTSFAQNGTLIDFSSYATNTAITNTSNYASNISNVLTIRDATNLLNTSNYASNISNVLTIRDATNLLNTSNYASNISNVLLINTSNYASNISNVLTIRDATNLINTSNYASNISNVLLINTSNYASNISNVLLINTSNYASNISNVLLINTSNLLYNPNYTTERPYPSKLWNSIDASTTSITYNGLPALKLNFTLDITGITYGSGAYIITFSNKFIIDNNEYGTIHAAKLFDYITNTHNSNVADFLNTNIVGYNLSGDYIGERYLAETSYKGEWFFLKLPVQILLTKIAIIGNSTYVIRNPALWRIYGSNDGILWEEIIEGRQSTRLVSTDYSNYSYTINKIISTQTKLYNHIGMNINAIISGQELSFIEFQIFGKEFFYSPIYSTITDTNTAIGNTSNYSLNISNILKANIDTKQNILSFTSPIVNTTNTITFNESSITSLTNFYNKTEANARYLPLAGGDLTGTLNIKTGTSVIHFGTRLIDNLLTLWGDGTSTYGIGINNATLRYNVPTNTTHRFYTGTTNTVTIDGSGNVGIGITNPFASLSIGTPAAVSDGTLTISKNYTAGGFRNFKIGLDGGFNFCIGDFGSAVSGNTWRPTDLTINWQTGNVGIGISGQTQKLYVNGSVYITAATTINAALTATSFSGDGANITSVPYSTITGKPTIYTQSEIDAFLNAKQNTLTASTVLSGIGSNLTLVNYNTLSNLPDLTVYNGWTKTGNNVYNTITGGNVGVGLNTNITHKLTVNGLSSTNGMLVGFVNTSNFYPNETGSYIVLRHNTFSGLIGANNPKPECAFIMANNSSTGSLNWSFYSGVVKYAATTSPDTSLRYDIGSGLIPNTLQTLTGTNTFNPLMSFLYTGNIGIGSISPLYKLDVNGSLNSTSLYQNGTIIDFTSYATKNTDIINTSNYASNVSNVLLTNANANYLLKSGGTMTGAITLPNTIWSIKSADNVNRISYATNGATYFHSGNTTGTSFAFKNNADTTEILTISDTGNTKLNGQLNISTSTIDNQITLETTATTNFCSIKFKNNGANYGYIGIAASALTGGGYYVNNLFLEATNSIIFNSGGQTSASANSPRMILNSSGNLGIGTTNPLCKLQVNGIVNITNTSPYATANNKMQSGSLTIGDQLLNYGGGNNWTANTAGLMLECLNNTEIAVHDAGQRIASLMYYSGNTITIGRDMGWNAISSVTMNGNISCSGTISTSGHLIYNYLFNNTGLVHSSTNDFNAITNFGYIFVQGNINAPNTLYAQWYQWTIGLGIDYAFSSFAAQFALPRNTNNPYLYIRYRESGTWGLWNSIRVVTADQCLGLAAGNQTISGALTVTEYITCKLYSVDYVGYDRVGVLDVSGTGQNNSKILRQIWNSFTDFHRCFIDDELFSIDNPQEFKDIYMGRIVVSTGTIKTHSSKTKTDGETEWEIKTGKEAIIIEDAHPMVELSRKKKDKRVLGVLGLNTRKNSHPERLIVNSIGEGGIWICNSNGNIENGDYITSSDYLGYGEKQDDDLLHNYTVAKATMDCDFQLDSPLYQCLELSDTNIRIAFIACTYHCG